MSNARPLIDRIHPELRETYRSLPPGGLMKRENVREIRAMTVPASECGVTFAD